MNTILQARDFSYTYPGSRKSVLNHVNLKIEKGCCYCLTGATGSGKTTLALALKGLLEKEGCGGEIIAPPQPDPSIIRVGLVLQNPETQLLSTTVGAEVAFGLENICVDPAAMPNRVKTALFMVNLSKPLDFPVANLSMGQKYRLLVAALIVMEPQLLVLDEPSAQLDPEGITALCKVLSDLKKRGVAIVLCEHHPGPLLKLVDRFWRIDDDGRLSWGRWQAPNPSWAGISPGPATTASFEAPLLRVRDLTVNGAEDTPLWRDVSFDLIRGRRVVVTGLNGTGKTTLLRVLAGFLKPKSGSVRIFDARPVPQQLRFRLGCLFQNPHKQLFENTVREEIAFPLKRLGWSVMQRKRCIDETLNLCSLETLADHSPHKLSYGQKRLVALASVLAPSPEMLLLDDPFAGLDGFRQKEVMQLLDCWNKKRGITLLWTSHDPIRIPILADGHLHIEGGRIAWQ